MRIYKVIAEFGLDRELDSIIFTTIDEAIKCAQLWLKNEDCDAVEIAEETPDEKYHRFFTTAVKRITK